MKLLLRNFRWTFSRLNQLRQYSQEKSTETTQYQNLILETSNEITTICINRPSTRNSLDRCTLHELSAALHGFDRDPAAKVVVLAGEGGNLSSGFDIDELKEYGLDAMRDAARPLLRRPLTDKPSVCAVSGFAVGQGLELALACDLRVIEDTSVLAFLGRRFGVPNGIDGGARLASLVGLSRALDLVLTGRMISGTVAHDWGLSSRLVATGTGIGQAINLGMSLVKFPQAAMLCDKMAVVNCQLAPEWGEDVMRNEAVAGAAEAALAHDISEGVDKFKRGIGKHGKSYGLTDRKLKSWEYKKLDQLM